MQFFILVKRIQVEFSPEFKPVVESLIRIENILKKAKYKGDSVVKSDLFEDNSENELYLASQNLQAIDNFTELYEAFVSMQKVIDRYFEVNMIMAKDEAVKNNRLAQLSQINELATRLGALSKLVIK